MLSGDSFLFQSLIGKIIVYFDRDHPVENPYEFQSLIGKIIVERIGYL